VLVACLETLGIAALPVLPEPTWRRIVEQHHVELGMVVVTRWQLPEALAEVIEHHHTPQTCMRVYRPLVQLIAIVDQILEILDRAPSSGIAALSEVPGVDHDERYRIGALMPKVAEQMAQFEAPLGREVASPIAEPAASTDETWPVDFAIESRHGVMYRACSVTLAALAFHSPVRLQPAWLTQLTLHCRPEPITMLVHVTACRADAAGGYAVTVQPFGLAGDDEREWLQLIARAQRAQPPRP